MKLYLKSSLKRHCRCQCYSTAAVPAVTFVTVVVSAAAAAPVVTGAVAVVVDQAVNCAFGVASTFAVTVVDHVVVVVVVVIGAFLLDVVAVIEAGVVMVDVDSTGVALSYLLTLKFLTLMDLSMSLLWYPSLTLTMLLPMKQSLSVSLSLSLSSTPSMS